MFVAAILVAQYAGTLDLLDTTRIAGRATQPPPTEFVTRTPGAVVIAADAATAPLAILRLRHRRLDCSLSYAPTFTASDLELGFNLQTLHAGTASVGWQEGLVRVTLSETATYGRFNSANLYQPPTAPSQPTTPQTGPGQVTMLNTAPAPTTIDVGSSNTNATIAVRASRRVTFTLSGGYIVSGGVTTFARQFLPEQFGPIATTSVTYAVSRRDSLATIASAQDTITSGVCPGQVFPTTSFCRQEAPIAQVQETFRRQVSPTTNLSLGAGAAASIQDTATERDLVILPVAVASVSTRLTAQRTFTVSALAAPNVDVRTGLVSDRVQTTASLSDRLSPAVTLAVYAGWLQSVPFPRDDPFPVTAFNGGIDVRIRVHRQVDLGLGYQAFWQDQSGYGTVVSQIGYVSVTGRVPTLHF